MCRHVLNAQVLFRAACCGAWVECSECHDEEKNHELRLEDEMVFTCKKCDKCFRKRMAHFKEVDEYCPFCKNRYVLEAETEAIQ